MRPLLLPCLALLPWPALAGTISVGEGQDYPTLAEAVAAAEAEDTLILIADTFSADLIIDKSLTIVGAGLDKTLIIGESSAVFTVDADVTFKDLEVKGFGGRLLVADTGDLTLSKVRLSGGRHAESGAGIWFTGDTLTLEGCQFNDNRALDGIGGHVFARLADVAVTDSTFERGLARRGGAIYVGAGTLTVSGSTFKDNAVRGERYEDEQGPDIEEGMGGAIAAESSTVTLSASVFDNNQVDLGRGGHINVLGGEITMVDVELLNRYASERYGGGMATFSSQVSITGGRFEANEVTTKGIEDNDAANGAGLFLHGTISAHAGIDGTTFKDNVATMHGGAIRIAGGTAKIDNAHFEGNDGYFGGGVHVATQFAVLVQNSTFTGNKARFGAAVRWRPPNETYDTSDLQLLSNVFTDNVATDYGGVLYARSGGTFSARGNRMERNQGNLGGALMLWDLRDVDVVGNTFCLNIASEGDVPDGGGIASYVNGSDGHVRIANNVFAENRATTWGGGVSLLQDRHVVVENNHFVGNRASSGGALATRDSSALIRNNLFGWASGGYGVSGSEPEMVKLAYNAWYQNLEANVDAGFAESDTSLLDEDPALKAFSANGDCTDDIYELLFHSPLIDAGDPELLDPDGSVSDIGAYGGPDAPADLFVDQDGDGYTVSDCDDDNDDIHPGVPDIPYDGIDQDCSGADLTDVDGDGFDGGDGGPDCNDEDGGIHPDAEEVYYDGIDADCDGLDDYDQDGDGVLGGGGPDCNNQNSHVFPGADEVDGDGVDSDCDGKDGAGACGGCAGGATSPAWLALLTLALLRRRQ